MEKNFKRINGFLHLNRISSETGKVNRKNKIGLEEFSMKKLLAGILAAVMVGSVGMMSSFAAVTAPGWNFVDENGDGVCDYAGTGRNFVDEDGDGVCDYYGSGMRMGGRAGRGSGFCGGCRR